MKIETDRLLIRPLTLDDVDDSFEHRGDPEVSRYTPGPITREQAEARIQAQLDVPWAGKDHQKLMLAIELKESGKLIGELMFKYTDVESGNGEIGYRLNRHYQGKGYAFEAVSLFIRQLFSELGVHKIIALCATDNDASWRLMEKLGMTREGAMRSHFRLRGQRFDAYSYAILATDTGAKTLQQ